MNEILFSTILEKKSQKVMDRFLAWAKEVIGEEYMTWGVLIFLIILGLKCLRPPSIDIQ